jgi:hypothetical protein
VTREATAIKVAAAAILAVVIALGVWWLNRQPSLHTVAKQNLEAMRTGDIDTLCRYATSAEQDLFCKEESVKQRLSKFFVRAFAGYEPVGGPAVVDEQVHTVSLQQPLSASGAISAGMYVAAFRTDKSAVCPSNFSHALGAAYQALAKPIQGEISPERTLRGMKEARTLLELGGIGRIPGREGEPPITWDEAIQRQQTRVQIVKARKAVAP